MTNTLQLYTTKTYNGLELDCYVDTDHVETQDFWATREQIGRLLGYENPRISVANIHNRNKKRLDKFSAVINLITPSGTQDVTVYNFKGLLEICRYSNQVKANDIMDWLWEVADEIRRTGSYSVKADSKELEIKRRDLDLRGAQILQSMIDKQLFPMTPETRTVFAHEVFKLVTGRSYLAMLPESKEKWYTAREIGDAIGLSANMVGRIAKANGLKAPEGESNKYGRWIFSKSRYSSREVPSFIYTQAGFDWFKTREETE